MTREIPDVIVRDWASPHLRPIDLTAPPAPLPVDELFLRNRAAQRAAAQLKDQTTNE
jgi:hypothetical protein